MTNDDQALLWDDIADINCWKISLRLLLTYTDDSKIRLSNLIWSKGLQKFIMLKQHGWMFDASTQYCIIIVIQWIFNIIQSGGTILKTYLRTHI